MSRPLPLAAVQAAPLPVETSTEAFVSDVQRLLLDFPDIKLAVYPELHLCGTDHPLQAGDQWLQEASEPLDGPLTRRLAELAGDLGIWLVPGSVIERGEDELLYNTSLAFSRGGRLAAFYRKVFPWRPYEPFEPGNRFVVFDMKGFGRAGLSICYDAWFPEVSRHLAWLGAEVILNVVKTTTRDRAQELVLERANAITNQVFVVSVNCAGPVGTGLSLVVDPEGIVRVQAVSEAPQFSPTSSISITFVTSVRSERPALTACGTSSALPIEFSNYRSTRATSTHPGGIHHSTGRGTALRTRPQRWYRVEVSRGSLSVSGFVVASAEHRVSRPTSLSCRQGADHLG